MALHAAAGKFLGNGETVFNVGANVGYLGLWLARHAQRKGHAVQVIGFEPEPTNLAQMHRNVALNPSLSVICEPIALGNFDGSADFYSTSTGNGDGAASFKPRQAATRVKVTVRKLDTYLAGEGVKPDWLILDVEGSGGDVLLAGRKPFANIGRKLRLRYILMTSARASLMRSSHWATVSGASYGAYGVVTRFGCLVETTPFA